MSDHHRSDFSERLVDLAADHAAGFGESGDTAELNQLDPTGSARRAFEAIAAEIDCAFADTDPVPMPEGLQERLMSAVPASASASNADQAVTQLKLTDDAAPVAAVPTRSPATAWFPWLVAAAAIVIAGGVLLQPQQSSPDPVELTAAQQRDLLIANADPDSLLRYQWTATEDPAVTGEVSGELVWDEAKDEGYMTISGLEVNDPSTFQYQLWIFDATRPQGDLPQFAGPFDGLLTQRPIDGGVFDITDSGQVVIPIDAKLRVQQGVAFAVTVEPPGGVVVSDRSRVPLLAIPG